jgi:hypothetical protein
MTTMMMMAAQLHLRSLAVGEAEVVQVRPVVEELQVVVRRQEVAAPVVPVAQPQLAEAVAELLRERQQPRRRNASWPAVERPWRPMQRRPLLRNQILHNKRPLRDLWRGVGQRWQRMPLQQTRHLLQHQIAHRRILVLALR